jgi:hypothetical protein
LSESQAGNITRFFAANVWPLRWNTLQILIGPGVFEN